MSKSFARSIAPEGTKSSMNINEGSRSPDEPSVNLIDRIKSEDLEATTRGNIEIKEEPLETMGEDLDASTDDIEIIEEALETTVENLDASPGDDIEIKEEPLETTGKVIDASPGDDIEIKEGVLETTGKALDASPRDDIEIKEEPLETTGECDSLLKIKESKSLKAGSSNVDVCSITVMATYI